MIDNTFDGLLQDIMRNCFGQGEFSSDEPIPVATWTPIINGDFVCGNRDRAHRAYLSVAKVQK